MLRVVRWLFVSMAVLAVFVGGGLAYLFVVYPIADEPRTLVVERTPARLERGSYLAEHVSACTDCHSERDFSRFSGPVVEGTVGKGGQKFGRDLGMPGEIVAPNITPYKLGSWSDGEIVRALTSGVTPEGRALFPLMNYAAYANMCDEDVKALVSYLRALPSIENEPARTELDFPVNLIVRTLPVPAPAPKACPDPNDSVANGRYLVSIAGCADCHTPRDGNDLDLSKSFAGSDFPMPDGTVLKSANISPDVESGIGSWTKETFINRFATYRDAKQLHAVAPGDRQTIMPWSQFAGMTDRDLGSIYDYLRTQKAVRTETLKSVAGL